MALPLLLVNVVVREVVSMSHNQEVLPQNELLEWFEQVFILLVFVESLILLAQVLHDNHIAKTCPMLGLK